MDAWKVTFERVDSGATVEENSFNKPVPDTDITGIASIRNGVVQTTPAHLIFVLRYLAKLNLGYATNLTALETAVTNLTA